jgi:hypothetical protein
MLFKQLYGKKDANTFLNAPRNKSEEKSTDNDDVPYSEIV